MLAGVICMQKKCLIVDGNSLIFRAFHALPPMTALDGTPSNAIYGFMMMLLKAIESYSPDFCVLAFDEKKKTFRHEKFTAYKAGRAATPEELKAQIPLVKEILQAGGLGVVSLPGFEADDLLGTIAAHCKKENMQALLLTGDRDALQLVNENTALLYTRKGISEIVYFTPETVFAHYGVRPDQVVDWKALMGDSSDNIPGVPKVGEKTSVKLLQSYETLDNILEHADEISGKLGENIRENKALALLSKELATIITNAPLAFDIHAWTLDKLPACIAALDALQLRSVIEKIRRLYPDAAPTQTAIVEIESKEAFINFIARLKNEPVALHITADALYLCQRDTSCRLTLGDRQQTLFHNESKGLSLSVLQEEAKSLFTRPIICYDAKQLYYLFAGYQLPPFQLHFDTAIAAYLIDPTQRKKDPAPFENANELYKLYLSQMETLKQRDMLQLYHDIEQPLIDVLYAMEKVGFKVDPEYLKKLGEGYDLKIEELKQKIYASTGEYGFNLNSPKQLAEVLFVKLKLPSLKENASGASTDAETLEKLLPHHESIAYILEYRQLTKLKSTYIVPLLEKADASGRIHSSFDQTGTVTGRLSSNDPNLQNIPTRTLTGREIRRAFVAKEGYVLVDGDYSQIELRILAHISQDKAMLEAFRLGQDIHRRTAAEIEEIPLDAVSDEQRSAAKAVNFGIVYGISDFGLARNIGIPIYKAKKFIDKYFEKYPSIQNTMEQFKAEAKELGYAETLYQRKRPLPELKSKNVHIRNFAERAAINTPIQGTAADIIKLAMIRVKKRLEKEKLDAKLILQVHDELILEANEHCAEEAAALLKEEMESVASLRVPLVCEVNIGANWYESK